MDVDDLIRKALAEGIITADTESGVIYWANGKRVTPEMNQKGYLRFRITVGGRKCHFRVHRVIYMASKGSIPKGYHIDHINGNKQDNRIRNLQPLTDSENRRKQAWMRSENRSRPQPLLFFC